MKMINSDRRPDASKLRELAVAAGVDPRTVKKVFDGKPVRGMAGHRARMVLRDAGLIGELGAASAA